ncbi:MAG: hypothetical protein IPJ88_14510 [Myxococcales bacterium]|nr:MAG: hypothetical protein IPJ88_14510 [Myxococcales bacterium]
MKIFILAFFVVVLPVCLISGCGEDFSGNVLAGEINITPNRPSYAAPGSVPPYTGDDPSYLEAQKNFANTQQLWHDVVRRTCAVTEGVCHYSKEYPDLSSEANMLSWVSEPCNVRPLSHDAVLDYCEQRGDLLVFAGLSTPSSEIAYIDYIPGEYTDFRNADRLPNAEDPGLHIYLRAPIVFEGDSVSATAQFQRRILKDDEIGDFTFNSFDTRFYSLDGGTHIFGEVRDDRQDEIIALLFVNDVKEQSDAIRQGDFNRNGTFGHSVAECKTLTLFEPGEPLSSYVVARLRGVMPDPCGQVDSATSQIKIIDVPGTRMPLANQPLSISEMLALMCWIEGLNPESPDVTLGAPINYATCTVDPNNFDVLGTDPTWRGRIAPLLNSTCGGSTGALSCHGGSNPAAGLDLDTNDYDELYARLLGDTTRTAAVSTQRTELKLIEKTGDAAGDPCKSYLYLKLRDPNSTDGCTDTTIVGGRMPLPVSGVPNYFTDDKELEDLRQWILNGALIDE